MAVSTRLLGLLVKSRIEYELVSHREAFTAQEVAHTVHVRGGRLAKVVLVRAGHGQYLMVALPAPHHVDLEMLERLSGLKGLALASEEEVRRMFPDCEPGAMPPFGNLYELPLYLDSCLARQDEIIFQAGTHHEAIRISFHDYERLAGPFARIACMHPAPAPVQKTAVSHLVAGCLSLGLLLWAAGAGAATQINEIRTDHTGTDTDEYFELSGTPGASLSGLSYIVLGDLFTGGKCGVVESVTDLSAWSLMPDGLLCLRKSTDTPILTGYDGAVVMNFENTDNLTHMLVSGFTGTNGQDLDTNDDGVLDVTPWTSVLDCVGLDSGIAPDCANDKEYLYCGTHVGPDGGFVPGHVYRASDTHVWIIGEFGTPGNTDTPGEPNYSSAGPPPRYVDMFREPCVPLSGQPSIVTMVAKNNPTTAEVRYRVNGGAEMALEMDWLGALHDTVTFFAQLPPQTGNGTRVEYYCNAWNFNPNPSRSYGEGYFVGTTNISALRVNDVAGSNLYRYYGARVRGRVTVGYGTFDADTTDYYVQDATGGINVFSQFPHVVQPLLGDDVTVAGSLYQYSGGLEMTVTGSCDTVLVTVNGHGSPPAPRVLARCDLGEDDEGMLVKIMGMTVDIGADVTFVGNKSYRSVSCYPDLGHEMRVDKDTNIPGATIQSNYMDIVGIAGQYDSSTPYDYWYDVLPRSRADITFLTAPTAVPDLGPAAGAELGPCVPNPVARAAVIQYRIPESASGSESVPARLVVFDLNGRTVATLVDGPLPPGEHTAILNRSVLGANPSGVYFYRLETAGAILTRKLVMLHF